MLVLELEMRRFATATVVLTEVRDFRRKSVCARHCLRIDQTSDCRRTRGFTTGVCKKGREKKIGVGSGFR